MMRPQAAMSMINVPSITRIGTMTEVEPPELDAVITKKYESGVPETVPLITPVFLHSPINNLAHST